MTILAHILVTAVGVLILVPIPFLSFAIGKQFVLKVIHISPQLVIEQRFDYFVVALLGFVVTAFAAGLTYLVILGGHDLGLALVKVVLG